jgi:hypothetical protein
MMIVSVLFHFWDSGFCSGVEQNRTFYLPDSNPLPIAQVELNLIDRIDHVIDEVDVRGHTLRQLEPLRLGDASLLFLLLALLLALTLLLGQRQARDPERGVLARRHVHVITNLMLDVVVGEARTLRLAALGGLCPLPGVCREEIP